MKFLICLVLFSTLTFAKEMPLLVEISRSGFTPPQYAYTQSCGVFENRVEIFRKDINGDHQKVVEVAKDPSRLSLLLEASKGELESFPSPADIPYLLQIGHLPQEDGTTQEILLYGRNSEGDMIMNTSPSAVKLTELLDSLCKF